ncbi:MAG: sulfotransferase [Acidobacteriota bacterium]
MAAEAPSELVTVQPITFESMRIARGFAANDANGRSIGGPCFSGGMANNGRDEVGDPLPRDPANDRSKRALTMVSRDGGNLVFICGLPRSGSTLLSAILGNHGEVCCPPEPWILLRLAAVYGPPGDGVFDDCSASIGVRQLLNEDEFLACARELAVTAYNLVLNRHGGRMLVDKTPRYYHILDFIERLFPAARFIWLKRDPLDMAASYKATWDRGVEFLTGEILDPHTYDLVLGLPALIRCFDRPSPTKYELRYEDLVRDASREVSRLAEFCSLEYDPSMLELGAGAKGLQALRQSRLGDQSIFATGGIHTDSLGAWKKQLSADEARRLVALLGRSVFLRMGYSETVDRHSDLFAAAPDEATILRTRQEIVDRLATLSRARQAAIYDLENRLQESEQQLGEEHRRARAYLAEHERLESSLAIALSQLRKLRASRSFRLGRAILWPPRQLRDLLAPTRSRE